MFDAFMASWWRSLKLRIVKNSVESSVSKLTVLWTVVLLCTNQSTAVTFLNVMEWLNLNRLTPSDSHIRLCKTGVPIELWLVICLNEGGLPNLPRTLNLLRHNILMCLTEKWSGVCYGFLWVRELVSHTPWINVHAIYLNLNPSTGLQWCA